MDRSFTNSLDELATARHDPTDWARLSREERIRAIELDGYVVIPDLLSPDQLEVLRTEIDELPMHSADYSHIREVRASCGPAAARRSPA